MSSYDVIIVGGGHAGSEAALASAKLGARTVLITMSLDHIAAMSCNPAIGGTAKGHLVKEIDALGGAMAKVIDHTAIQFRVLNKRRGPAIWSSRAQADMYAYSQFMKALIEQQANLSLIQDSVDELLVDGSSQVYGVKTKVFGEIRSHATVLTTGTFLSGLIHIGETKIPSGRASEQPSLALAKFLKTTKLRLGRLKTGTPPRLDGRTIHFDQLEKQHSDQNIIPFSFSHSHLPATKLIPMYLSHTVSSTHNIIRDNLNKSSLYSGQIDALGPRYCPSIEDKIVKFPSRERHQIFLEPVGLNTHEVYPNGISTSLPLNVQKAMINSIPGLEKAHIRKPGYAIEYDFLDPIQLKASLETQYLKHLFLAGQINGTTGYEEAAAQGLMAGINAARLCQGSKPLVLPRSQAYIGVLIDDLVTKGTQEPYRMFTSRAEHRLHLREDNADLRLTPLGRAIGLVTDKDYELFLARKTLLAQGHELINRLRLGDLNWDLAPDILRDKDNSGTQLKIILQRKGVSITDLAKQNQALAELPSDILQRLAIEIRYHPYLEREKKATSSHIDLDKITIPTDFNYALVGGLSKEIIEKLTRHQPENLGQASRISAITPASIGQLRIYLKHKKSVRAPYQHQGYDSNQQPTVSK
ncbi:MAG: tRNA uridine-5-carboxymethylaminomethyl(34) synthesis enzyme MnmG [Proteobacteria bacterium]|nr:tRNA uridine-5-carboxymethylaminomethyl(34) synthesis enzyme MnmG [Pseudomonadota bacterium]